MKSKDTVKINDRKLYIKNRKILYSQNLKLTINKKPKKVGQNFQRKEVKKDKHKWNLYQEKKRLLTANQFAEI